MTWCIFAFVYALGASATAILGRIGTKGVPSNLATAIRTAVVLVIAWGLVFATREHVALRDLKARPVLFLVLSGIGTGVSWFDYFKASQMAPASRVAPIDWLSLTFTIVLAAVLRGELISWTLALRASLMVAGALLTLDP